MELQQKVSRLGKFTASSIYLLLKRGRAKDAIFGDAALTYIYEKIAEIITGESKQQAKSSSLDWGNEHEKDAYMWLNKMIPHTYLGRENFKFYWNDKYSGGSPDGENEDTIFEYKCPYTSANHIQWLLGASGDNHNKWLYKNHFDYYCQLQFNMKCTGKKSGVIASYDPRTVEPEHRMAVLYIKYDAKLLSQLDTAISEAVKIIQAALGNINKLTLK